MTFDISVFRCSFPEFGNTEVYTDGQIEFWSNVAQLQVKECYWKSGWLLGVSLYTAHQLVLASQNFNFAGVGGQPGLQGGIANSKTVGNASVSYDTTSTSEKNAGFWNLTTYGKQFFHLVRIYGAGVVQL